MKDEMDQVRLKGAEGEGVPIKNEIEDELNEEISKTKYERYYVPYLQFFNSVEEESKLTQQEVYDVIKYDASNNTKRKYLNKVFEYKPETIKLVVDVNPSAKALLKYALKRESVNISPETINDGRKACEDLVDDLYELYLNHHIERIEIQTENSIEEPIPDEGKIPVHQHQEFIREFGKNISEELPEDLTSFKQSITNLGGTANEKITFRSLSFVGLEEGNHFIDVSSDSGSDDSPEDLLVKTKTNAEPLHIEIKSASLKERGEAGASRIDDPSILFGYFDHQRELAGNYEQLKEETIAVYAPPKTLSEMSTKNPDKYKKKKRDQHTTRDDEWLFFRSNTNFAYDMKYYYENGSLPKRSIGHEDEHI